MHWQQAEQHHQSLVDNIRQFHTQLARLFSDNRLSDEKLAHARDAIIEYLTKYIQDAERPSERVTVALRKLHELGPEMVLERALHGANLAPDPVLGDPSTRWLAERERRLEGLDEWFLGRGGSTPQMTRIRNRGLDWVVQFLRVMDLRRTQRRRAVSIADDYRALARAFAACERPADAHRLFIAATQLHGARHHRDVHEEQVDAASPAVNNPAITLAATLRARKTTPRRRTESPVTDRRAQRAAAAAEQARRLEKSAELRQALVTDGSVRLSAFGRLDYEVYRDLIDLLCLALSQLPAGDGTRMCLSHDGQVEIVVHPHHTAERCRLVTDRGVLTAPNFRVSVRLRRAGATPKPAAKLA